MTISQGNFMSSLVQLYTLRFRDSVDADICIGEEAQAADVFVGPTANGFFCQSFAFGTPAQGYPSIRGRQPSDSKFDLAVGELAPIFDNGRIATERTFVEELAGLSPSLLQRQSEIFMCQVVILA